MKENYTDSSSKQKSQYTIEFGERITFKSLSEEFEIFDRDKALCKTMGELKNAIKDLTKETKDNTSSMKKVSSSFEKDSTSIDEAIKSMKESNKKMAQCVSTLVEMAADFHSFLKNCISIFLFFCLAYLWKTDN